MAKPKVVYICRACGTDHPKWQGQCKNCGEWNTLQEEIIPGNKKQLRWDKSSEAKPKAQKIVDIPTNRESRLATSDSEFNRVLGGGLVPGSVTLIGGQPGIGKSTLLLQLALNLGRTVLYVSGEESPAQIKMRANRLGKELGEYCYLLAATETEKIIEAAKDLDPDWLIIDSVQTLRSMQVDSGQGSITQIRECTAMLTDFVKARQLPMMLIGHITKEGVIAGPKLLEHMVDCVLQFEGDRRHAYRLLRSIKNRFGSTDELGIYEMQSSGLHAVENPSMMLMESHSSQLSGSAISATIEGMRPMMVEVQSLVSTAVYGTPQRSTTGFDLNRLHMLLAVLEKRAGYFFNQKDVFLNIAGGFRISDPSIDLAVIAAMVSSFEDEAWPSDVTFAGEVGLSGEVRPVARPELRLIEADRMGFTRIYLPAQNVRGLNVKDQKIEVVPLERIDSFIERLTT